MRVYRFGHKMIRHRMIGWNACFAAAWIVALTACSAEVPENTFDAGPTYWSLALTHDSD